MRGTLVICSNLERLSREAAQRVAAAARTAERRFAIALSGGATPRRLYQLLGSDEFRAGIPWEKIHFFWGDERLVPADHPESNYRMARENLLRHLPVPPENVHPVKLLSSFEETATAYENELRRFFNERRRPPVFDLILLGVGSDGHTASLFPRAPELGEKERIVVVARSPVGTARVTLTLPVLHAGRRLFFLVSGPEKAAILRRVLEEEGELPAQRVAASPGELVWLVDQAAASELERFKVDAAEAATAGSSRRSGKGGPRH